MPYGGTVQEADWTRRRCSIVPISKTSPTKHLDLRTTQKASKYTRQEAEMKDYHMSFGPLCCVASLPMSLQATAPCMLRVRNLSKLGGD